MNGIGVGTAVGLGCIVALGIVGGSASVIEYVATFSFYGVVTGFIVEMWRMALKDWKPPFRSGRR